MVNYTMNPDLRRPRSLIARYVNALRARRIVTTTRSVPGVFAPCGQSKIGSTVVVSATVDVIDFSIWPYPVENRPCRLVGCYAASANRAMQVAIPVLCRKSFAPSMQ